MVVKRILIPCLMALASLSFRIDLSGQTIDRIIELTAGGQRLVRPVQLALSPSGSSLAVCDQNANRIFVLDPDGTLLWTIGESGSIGQPAAVCFDGEDAVLFALKSQRLIFRTTKAEPTKIDTIADLAAVLPKGATVDQLIGIAGNKHLILDRHGCAIYRLKANWELDRKLISHGDRKGELWAPAAMAVDLSGDIIVADEGTYPVQTFSSDGRFLFVGSWNAPQSKQIWSAGAVAVSRDETVWVADVAGSQWRVFDRSGNELGQYRFTPPIFRPNAMIITPDNRLVVAEERGSVVVLRLP